MKYILRCCIALILLGSAAHAQAPAAAPQAAAGGAPQVSLCVKEEIRGPWKLKRVFETPAGAWTEDLNTYPHQYRRFLVDGSTDEVKGKREFKRAAGMRKAFAEMRARASQQYVLGDKGLLYIYTGGKHTMTYYCGLVREDRAPYMIGDIVLTPAHSSTSKIYLLYGRPFAPPRQATQSGMPSITPGAVR